MWPVEMKKINKSRRRFIRRQHLELVDEFNPH